MADLLRFILTNQIVAFVIVVGVVVFVHELGHFLAARLFGIAVEEFAIGFGPKAFGMVRGGTEYKICWLPLGGYVRLYGAEIGREIPLETRHRAISTAPLHKRACVVFAGPLANGLLTWAVLSAMSLSGVEKLPPSVSVMPNGVAARSGLRDGDTIVTANGASLTTWEEFTEVIAGSPGQQIVLRVRHREAMRDIVVVPELVDDESMVGERTRMGRIGVTPYFQSPRFAISSEGLLGKIGLRSGDEIRSIGGTNITFAHEVEQSVERWTEEGRIAPLVFEVLRPDLFPRVVDGKIVAESEKRGVLRLSLSGLEPWFSGTWTQSRSDGFPFASFLGAVSTDLMLVAESETEAPETRRAGVSAFDRCGVQSGMSLVAIGGYGTVRSRVQINDWLERTERSLSQGVMVGQELPAHRVDFTLLNARGTIQELSCSIPVRVGRDHLNRPHAFLPFPFRFLTRGGTVEPILVKSDGLLAGLRDGAKASWDLGRGILGTVGKLVTGKIPVANLGGPIEIARVAGSAAKVGLSAFVTMIAFISINVGLLNLLPIPVLDGGSLLLLGVEAAYGKSLPLKLQETVQKIGVMFILGLILLVIYNDILRRISN
jgi:regulator of sigma E protease